MVVIEVKDLGKIKIELDEQAAPITAKNFRDLVEKGFYNGLIFHRVIADFMIQGGCPEGTGMGGPGYSIKGEFAANGVDNPLKHVRGVVSMARAMDPDSAGSQFFIMHADAPYLDGQYAAFGRVVEGMDVVDEIANSMTDYNDRPYQDVVMEKVYWEDSKKRHLPLFFRFPDFSWRAARQTPMHRRRGRASSTRRGTCRPPARNRQRRSIRKSRGRLP